MLSRRASRIPLCRYSPLCLSASPKHQLLLYVPANIQYSDFGTTLKITQILNFCSTSLTGRLFSIFVILGGPRKGSKKSSFCKSKIIKKWQGFTLFFTSRGAQHEVQKVSFLPLKFMCFKKRRFWNNEKTIVISIKFTSCFHENRIFVWSKNGQNSTSTKLLPEMPKSQKCQYLTIPWALWTPHHAKIRGPQRGLKRPFLEAFLRQKRSRV